MLIKKNLIWYLLYIHFFKWHETFNNNLNKKIKQSWFMLSLKKKLYELSFLQKKMNKILKILNDRHCQWKM